MATRKKPVNAGYLTKEPSAVHEGFAAYIAETTGADDIGADTVSIVQRLYPLYLKSPAVVKAREEAAAAAEAEKRAKEEARQSRLKERLDKIEEQRRKVLAELGLDAHEDSGVINAAERFSDSKGIVFAEADEPFEEEPEEEAPAPVKAPRKPAAKKKAAPAVTLPPVVEEDEDEDEDDLWEDEEEEEEF